MVIIGDDCVHTIHYDMTYIVNKINKVTFHLSQSVYEYHWSEAQTHF